MADYDIKITLDLVSKVLDTLTKNLEKNLSSAIEKGLKKAGTSGSTTTPAAKGKGSAASKSDIKALTDSLSKSLGAEIRKVSSGETDTKKLETLLSAIEKTLKAGLTDLAKKQSSPSSTSIELSFI